MRIRRSDNLDPLQLLSSYQGGNRMMNGRDNRQSGIEVFISYAHEDDQYRKQLIKHLSALILENKIHVWHDEKIPIGEDWNGEIDEHLNSADLIIMLISSNFLHSSYIFNIEVKVAMSRHESGEARLLPIIVRTTDWQDTLLGQLQALPKNGKPIEKWSHKDDAYADIAKSIRQIIAEMNRTAPSAADLDNSWKLPRALDYFVGRDAEIEQICTALSKKQVVQLRGLGGSGKSALAIEAAYRLKDAYADSIIWLYSPELKTLEHYVHKFASIFNIRLNQLPLPDKITFLQKSLANRSTLLILDNVEDVKLVKNVLDLVPHFPAILTCRPQIQPIGDVNISMKVLSDKDAFDLFKVRSCVEISEAESKTVKEICAGLGNFPLAIELAAKLMHYAGYTFQLLKESIEKSSLDAIDLPEFFDDRKVVASLHSTFQILEDHDKELFSALGLFPGRTFTLDAIKAISGLDEKTTLSILHKKLFTLSLVNIEGSHYSLHPLLKCFAQAQVKPEMMNIILKRMADYYSTFAKIHAKDFESLEVEMVNLLGIFDWSLENKECALIMDFHEALIGKLAFFGFLSQHSHWSDAIKRLEHGIAALKDMPDCQIGHFYLSLGLFHYYLGNNADARIANGKAIECFSNMGAARPLVVAYWQSGYIEDDEDNYSKAMEYYQCSLQAAQNSVDCKDYVLNSRKLIGVVKYHQGDLEGAAAEIEASLKEARKNENKADISTCERRLAAVYRRQAELCSNQKRKQELLDASRTLLMHCLDIESHQRSVARAWRQLGMVDQAEGNLATSKEKYIRSLELFQKIANRKGIAAAHYNIGTILTQEGNFEEAAKLIRMSIEVGKALNIHFGVALNLRQWGIIEYNRGNPDLGKNNLVQAVEMLARINSPYLQETKEILAKFTGHP